MKLPQSFLDLHAAGRFDYWGGKQYHDMDDAERGSLLRERRNEVLWLRGIEWDIEPDDVTQLDWARPGLFAFAGNGAGDQYAWYPTWQGDAPEAPVVLVIHDEYVSQVFAPSFALTLYRLWLEHAAEWDNEYDGGDRTSALRAWAGIIAPHLDDDTRAALEALTVDLSPAELRATLDVFVASLPSTELATALLPTRYNPDYVKGEAAERAYAKSIAFFEKLVEEGHESFRGHIVEARTNRDAALAAEAKAATPKAVASKSKPEKTTAPKAEPAKKAAPRQAAPKKAAKAKPARKAAPKKAAKAKPAKKAAPKKAAPKKAVEKAVEKALVTAAKAVGTAVKRAAKAVKKAAKKAVPKPAKRAKKAKKDAPKKAVKKAKKAALKKAAPKKAKKAAPKKAKPARKASRKAAR